VKIVPFTCSACEVEFYQDEGGFCAVCQKPFCIIDLYGVLENDNKVYFCEACKGNRPGRQGKNEGLSMRRKLIQLKGKP
jgi:predicted amidophosphoribosyltransferase